MKELMKILQTTSPKVIAIFGIIMVLVAVILVTVGKSLYYRVRYLSAVDKVMPESGSITTWYSEEVGAQVIDIKVQYWRQDRGTWSNIKHAVQTSMDYQLLLVLVSVHIKYASLSFSPSGFVRHIFSLPLFPIVT